MKTKILSILALLLTVTQGAWAQTSADKGRILAADGKMYKNVTLANKVSSARAVVAYVGSVAHYWDHCLCLALVDASGPCNWEGAKTAAGSWAASNSITLGSTTYDKSHTSWDWASDDTETSCQTRTDPIGYGWRIPNVTDWRYIMEAYGGPSATSPVGVAKGVYGTTVRSAINTACGNSGLNTVAYWTCSTLTGSSPAEKWGVHFQNGDNKDVFWTYGLSELPNLRLVFAPGQALTNGYVVEYDANGGSGAPAAQSKTHGTALTLSSTVPTRTGYTFAGWATSAEGAVEYSAGGSYTTDNDIVLYAQWTPTYTATFATGNDNTGWTIDPASGAEGATVTVSYTGENKVKSVTVKGISAVTSAPTANDLTYTGSAQNLVTAGTATYGTMVYSLDGETYSAAIPTATNAGDYTVYYKVDGGTDYTGTTAQTVDVTITIPGTIALLKSAINSATNLDYINTNALGKYVTATGTLQSTSAGAVGIITYMSKSAVDTDVPESRILVFALTDASTGAQQYKSDTPEATYTDRTALNGHQVTEHWHSWPSDFPASEAARNYSASLPSGASSWFLPSEAQWSASKNYIVDSNHYYWTSTGNNGADNNGRVYDYTWGGIGSAQRISSYYVRAAFVF